MTDRNKRLFKPLSIRGYNPNPQRSVDQFQSGFVGEVGARPEPINIDPSLYVVLGGTTSTFFGGIIAVEYNSSSITEMPASVANADLSSLPVFTDKGWGYARNIATGEIELLCNAAPNAIVAFDIPVGQVVWAPAIVSFDVTGTNPTETKSARIPYGVG